MFLKQLIVLCAIGVAYSQHAKYLCSDQINGVLVQNTQDCSTFFHCFNGLAILLSCESNQLFNANTRKCEPAAGVECFNRCPPSGYYDLFMPATNCNQFTRCFNGKPEQLTCAPGLAFDRALIKCNLATLVDCPFDLWCPHTHDELIFIRDRNDCSKYHVCVNGSVFVHTCPDPLLFNPETNMCDSPANTNCISANYLSSQSNNDTLQIE